ncbi:MAG: tetratricopeptide repeat protein, partial [Bacteroidia bacterium]|nr:tetratricopeptide repeat protein [Bacteroidia bacterium]
MNGNLDYAVQVLQEASEKDVKNPDIFLNLGNAYRKKDR